MNLVRLGNLRSPSRLLGALLATAWLAGCSAEVKVGADEKKEDSFGELMFDEESVNHKPTSPQGTFPVGTRTIFGFIRGEGLDPDKPLTTRWTLEGKELLVQNLTIRGLTGGGGDDRGVSHLDFELNMGAIGGYPPGHFGLEVTFMAKRVATGTFAVGEGQGFGHIVFAKDYDAEGVPLGYTYPYSFEKGIGTVYGIFRVVGVAPQAIVNATWTLNGNEVSWDEFSATQLYPADDPMGWGAMPLSNTQGLPAGSYALRLRGGTETAEGTFTIA